MIKGIASGNKYIEVSGGYPSPLYINAPSNTAMIGQLRYNPHNQQMEVYDGSIWMVVPSAVPSIQLSQDAVDLLEWARAKRAEDVANKHLADTHPAVKVAMDNLDKAKQQLEVTIILSKEHDKTTS